MVRVCDSNRFEELAAALVEELGPPDDPLAEHWVLVPSRAVAGRLEREIAQARGVSAGVRFCFFDAFVAERLERAGSERRVLSRDRLHAHLLGLLADADLLAAGDMAPVRAYLRPRSGDDDEAALRRFQLAGRLADLLEGYAHDRPELMRKWRHGPALTDDRWLETEAWQRRLFVAALERGRLETALALLEETPLDALALPERLHVFSLALLTPSRARMLARLAAGCDISLYTLNPSHEHWDDLEESDSPALRQLGRPGAIHRRMLGELSSWDFDSRFRDPTEAGDSALTRLQRDVLTCAPAGELSAAGGDPSVRVLACPGVRRELEIVAAEIWKLCGADDTLRFDQIAVLIAPSRYDEYQAQVSAVFSELHGIPHQVLDLPLVQSSRVARALDLLLDLPLGRFSRPDLLRLCTHPVVAGRAPDVDPDDWIRWTDRLGVVHGADRDDHAGTYIEHDRFHWDQGLRRLALGGFMAGEPSGVRKAAVLGGAPLLPEEVSGEAERSAAQFTLLCRSLIEDARAARAAQLPLAEWAVLFELMADTYLCPQTDEDERDLDRCREALARLGDLTALPSSGEPGAAIGYREARELARSQLASLRGSRGEGEGGVTVAPLSETRPLPFRVIFAAGLDESAFPGEDQDSPLDLRAARRAATDVGRRERDRHLFLHTLLSARDRILLSYVARDDRTGEEVAPSSVLLTLERLLGSPAELRERFPLRRWEAPPDPDPIAGRQARCRELRDRLEAECRGQGREVPAREALLEAVRADEPLARLLGLAPVPGPAAPGETAEATLSLSALRRFLECPLQAWAQTVLGLREIDFEDPIARAEEPFSTPRGPEIGILREVLAGVLLAGAEGRTELERAYAERAELEELSGHGPTGIFAAVERERHLALLESWRSQLVALAGAAPDPALYAFGRARSRERIDRLRPPIALEAGAQRIEIVGETQLVCSEQSGLGSTFFVAASRPRDRHFLRGFLDGAVLAAAGLREGEPHAATVVAAERAETRVFAPWSAKEAREYLGELASELFFGRHDYLLPCEAVFEKRQRPERSLERVLASLLAPKGSGCSSLWGPIRRLDGLAPPDDAESIAARRFARFFETYPASREERR